jgi:hypothetical protein
MEGMDRWDWILLGAAAYVAVTVLVRLMPSAATGSLPICAGSCSRTESADEKPPPKTPVSVATKPPDPDSSVATGPCAVGRNDSLGSARKDARSRSERPRAAKTQPKNT